MLNGIIRKMPMTDLLPQQDDPRTFRQFRSFHCWSIIFASETHCACEVGTKQKVERLAMDTRAWLHAGLVMMPGVKEKSRPSYGCRKD